MFRRCLRPPSQLPGFSVRACRPTLLFTAFLWNCRDIIFSFPPVCQLLFPADPKTATAHQSPGQPILSRPAVSPVTSSTVSPVFVPTRSTASKICTPDRTWIQRKSEQGDQLLPKTSSPKTVPIIFIPPPAIVFPKESLFLISIFWNSLTEAGKEDILNTINTIQETLL